MAKISLKGCGQVLRQAREEKQLSLRELADRLDWSRGTLSKYETNAVGVSLEVIDQIAEALRSNPKKLALRCLEERYRKLAPSKSRVRKLADVVFGEMIKKPKKTAKKRP